MPVKVYGTGGGKNTKDATAAPDDVRAGKTFYNAEGKQTGIWTPQATDYTVDADALPENVLNGKTFYNADGKQVGTYNEKTYSDFVSDATATQQDVASGKVFYNNKGRRVGSGTILNVSTVVVQGGITGLGSATINGSHIRYDIDKSCKPSTLEDGYSRPITNYGSVDFNFESIIGFTIEGIYYPVTFEYNTFLRLFLSDSTGGWTNPFLVIMGNVIYTCYRSKSTPITVHYI